VLSAASLQNSARRHHRGQTVLSEGATPEQRAPAPPRTDRSVRGRHSRTAPAGTTADRPFCPRASLQKSAHRHHRGQTVLSAAPFPNSPHPAPPRTDRSVRGVTAERRAPGTTADRPFCPRRNSATANSLPAAVTRGTQHGEGNQS